MIGNQEQKRDLSGLELFKYSGREMTETEFCDFLEKHKEENLNSIRRKISEEIRAEQSEHPIVKMAREKWGDYSMTSEFERLLKYADRKYNLEEMGYLQRYLEQSLESVKKILNKGNE
jgi:hypothetical protein